MVITLSLVNSTYYMNSMDSLWLPNLIFIYIIFYSIGYGPLPWILMPQICPRNVSYKFQIKCFCVLYIILFLDYFP